MHITSQINPSPSSSLLSPQQQERQKHRINMAAQVIVGALIQTVVLGIYVLAGVTSIKLVASFFVISAGSALAVFLFIKSGKNLKLDDKDMLAQQCLINGLIQLGFLIAAPKLAILFLLALLVLFAYGLVQLPPQQITFGWLLYGGVTGIALLLVKDRFGYPGTGYIELALIWVMFFLALRFFTFASAQFSHLRVKLKAKEQQLQSLLHRIDQLSRHDPLTGVLNRRSLVEILDAELQRSYRTGHPFCFVIIDLDHFRVVNEKHGHPAGDRVLKTVSDTAMKLLRALDRYGRLGGEEFGIVLPATWPDQGMIAMNRLTAAVAACDWTDIDQNLKITFSAGITTNATNDTSEAVIKRAEKALLQAKQQGRNRIVEAEEALPDTPPDEKI